MDHSFGGSLLFNGFDLDLKAPELRFEGKPVPMQLQPLKVLSFLASRPREVVSRASLRQHLWQQDTFVDFEAGLNFCIRQIRRTLGDNARRPHLVETLRRRGYRFIGSVARCEHGQPQQNSGQRKITVTVSPSGTERDDHAVAQITERIAQFLVSSYGNGHDPSPAAPMLRQDATIRHGGGDPAGWAVKRGPLDGSAPHREIRFSRGPLDIPFLVSLQVE